ncbi:hypothetical protein [Flavobacterium subsaxonicum]|uniref:hypothetical protein n=1 Tax=Flavobacterium subsaxonicum TaxID=426226 RepID=UPI001040CB77|nr:hypothetical protein [Flavobacterium subsaxonicum]
MQQSLELLLSEDIDAFIKSINGINYWGGSGAIWDVVLMDVSVNYTFKMQIVRLITLMQKTKIDNGKVKSIKKFLLSS